MTLLPMIAVAGLKLLPLTPLPLKRPPVGLPVKVIEPPLTHTEVGSPLKLTLGNGFTLMVWLLLLMQPFKPVYE